MKLTCFLLQFGGDNPQCGGGGAVLDATGKRISRRLNVACLLGDLSQHHPKLRKQA